MTSIRSKIKNLVDSFERDYAEWSYWAPLDWDGNPNSSRKTIPINRWRFVYEMIPVWLSPSRLLCRWFGQHGYSVRILEYYPAF
jgi:hypothetical protein